MQYTHPKGGWVGALAKIKLGTFWLKNMTYVGNDFMNFSANRRTKLLHG